MKNYLLMDFGASFLHTHHSRVIRGFVELLELDGCQLTVYLPMGSEIATVGKQVVHRRILVPSYHPVGFDLKNPTSWIPGVSQLLYRRTQNSKLHRIVSSLLSRLIVQFASFAVKRNIQTFPDSIVVFPTACPITVRLGSVIKQKFPRTKLVYRLTNTAEKRGYFTAHFDGDLLLSQLIRSFPDDIRIGYEMEEYANSLFLPKSNLYYSPTPPCLEVVKDSVNAEKKTFGFLGMAQKHKGIKWLMEIVVDTLTNVQANSLSWIIQTEDPPPRELLESLTSLQITLLPGRLTESEMSGAFAKVDLICLPYDVEMYRLNASALAYRAADNLTAVATFKGSAFGNEIEKFGIGLVVEDLNALKDGMSKFDTVSCRTQIFEYNKVRLQSNRDLLTW